MHKGSVEHKIGMDGVNGCKEQVDTVCTLHASPVNRSVNERLSEMGQLDNTAQLAIRGFFKQRMGNRQSLRELRPSHGAASLFVDDDVRIVVKSILQVSAKQDQRGLRIASTSRLAEVPA